MKRENRPGAVQQGFSTNLFYERILKLRRTDPRAFNSLAPATRHALNFYESQKREATRLQAIHNEPGAKTS